MNDESDYLKNIRTELEENKQEVRQLSEEIRRLKQKESSMDAENQILKSKLLQAESSEAQKDHTPSDPLSSFSVPKLQAPSSGSPR